MTSKRRTKTEIFTILSWLTPYIFILSFLRHTSVFTFMALLLFCGLSILGCLTGIFLTRLTKYKKGYYLLVTTVSVTLFVISYDQLINTSDRIFYSLHRSTMSEIVTKINKARIENNRILIPQVRFALVDTLKDGTIVFTIDGIPDNCVGIAYSDDNTNPGNTNCGQIVEWRRLDDHWYFWYST